MQHTGWAKQMDVDDDGVQETSNVIDANEGVRKSETN